MIIQKRKNIITWWLFALILGGLLVLIVLYKQQRHVNTNENLDFLPNDCEDFVRAYVAQTPDGGRVMIFDDQLRDLTPVLIAPIFLHEVHHHDEINGQPEEIIATAMETVSYARLLVIAGPEEAKELIGTDHCLARLYNLFLIMMINSGSDLNHIGLLPLPVNEPNTLPNTQYVIPSFVEGIRRLYPGLPNIETPGNEFLRSIVSDLTGVDQPNLNYSDETIKILDRNFHKILSNEDAVKLAQLLGLQIKEPTLKAPNN